MGWDKETICKLATKELFDGCNVVLGEGMSASVADYIPKDININIKTNHEYPDLVIVDAQEASEQGDFADGETKPLDEFEIPGPEDGSENDFIYDAKKVVVLLNHFNNENESNIVTTCSIPITCRGVVDLIITELAVFEVTKNGLYLIEYCVDTRVSELSELTDAPFAIAEGVKRSS